MKKPLLATAFVALAIPAMADETIYKNNGFEVIKTVNQHEKPICVLQKVVGDKEFSFLTTGSKFQITVRDASVRWAAGNYRFTVDGEDMGPLPFRTVKEDNGIYLAVPASANELNSVFAGSLLNETRLTLDFVGNATTKPIHYTINVSGMADAMPAFAGCGMVLQAQATQNGGM